MRYDTISFLSDYGLDDEFVGVVHSVIRSMAPDVAVIDVTHGIEPHDVRGGGLTLARSAQYLAPGVVVAVVDPGVGGARRGVAVEVGQGSAVLVGPDNGLLAPAVAMVGGADRAVELNDAAYHLPAIGSTFDGRDVFAPVASHLCLGVDLHDLGTPIDPAGLLPGVMPVAAFEGDVLAAEVLWVDRFGNAQLNVDPDEAEGFGENVLAVHGDVTTPLARVADFASVPPGGVGLLTDSYGLLALVADRGSAAEQLGLRAGSAVGLRASDDGDAARRGVDSPVDLGPTRGAR